MSQHDVRIHGLIPGQSMKIQILFSTILLVTDVSSLTVINVAKLIACYIAHSVAYSILFTTLANMIFHPTSNTVELQNILQKQSIFSAMTF